jgi:hypothetical protein
MEVFTGISLPVSRPSTVSAISWGDEQNVDSKSGGFGC